MTTIKNFEDLIAWQKARELAGNVYELTRQDKFSRDFGLRDQIQRAASSVMHNIAEGFERGSTAELLQFLYIARGSAGETRSKLRFMSRRPAFAVFKTKIERCVLLALSCGKQLRGWAETLQNSEIKGQRHLNDKSRAAF